MALKPTIVVMTKAPQPGFVKTRLRPILSDEQCASISRCFLLDTVAKAFRVTSNVIVAYSAIDDHGEIFNLLPESTICVRQSGTDLGERLVNAIDFAEANGGGPIVVIGTDSPAMPVAYLEMSFGRLEELSIQLVLGGTEDGGYYLIGLKKNDDRLFQGIPWSTDRVFATTLKRAKQLYATLVVELPKHYDIDTPDDLRRLYSEDSNGSDLKTICPETFRWIRSNRHIFDQLSDSNSLRTG